MKRETRYDAIIIGGGISGLTCGCFLAKAGYKTLIVEKNPNVGGYCVSFRKNYFDFDACAHSIGSLRENGSLFQILDELSLKDKLFVKRQDPADLLVSSDYKIPLWNDLDRTIDEFIKYFPKESRNIKDFFVFLSSTDNITQFSYRSLTFKLILDKYFKDSKLKNLLAFPVFINSGLPPSKLSFFTVLAIYKEFLFDGGYYPIGGMMKFPESLKKNFEESGGKVLISNIVKKITLKNDTVKGIVLENGMNIDSRYVISAVDATQTYFELLKDAKRCLYERKKIAKMEPSLSMFILYLGLKKNVKYSKFCNQSIWFTADYGVERHYSYVRDWLVKKIDSFLIKRINERSAIVYINAPFKNEEYWQDNRNNLINLFMGKLKKVIPDLAEDVIFKEAATPVSLYKQTFNLKGAAYGWSAIPSQISLKNLSESKILKNFYSTGQWICAGYGVSGVASIGKKIAGLILRKNKYDFS